MMMSDVCFKQRKIFDKETLSLSLSPIVFNLVVDMLVVLVQTTNTEGQIDSIVPHLIHGGLSILQYANGIVIFINII